MTVRLSDETVEWLAADNRRLVVLLAREVLVARKLRAALLAIDPDADYADATDDDFGMGYDDGWLNALNRVCNLIKEADDA